MKKSLDFLDELRKRGVKVAKFQDGEIFEVEFFGAEPEAPASEASSTLPADAGPIEDYEAALEQLRKRRFRKEVS
ncbi:MAG TPA: hypothetical protein VFZ53_04845 [Polyangiaceae bacterium]